MELVVLARLLAIREGQYTVYVFKNLETNSYIMCTRLPNWHTPNIMIGSEGFLSYNEVTAGEEYYHPVTEVKLVYNYSNVYFINFVQKQEIENNNIIL
jgi:hypothetical protein